MSYDPRDEVSSEISSKITDLLGGMIEVEENCYGFPFNRYNKGSSEIYSFFSGEDFDKVMDFINNDEEHDFYLNRARLIEFDENYCEMRFNLN
ncbi:MAG: hypothetical protein IJH63_03015 [Methanobrevibacter sp.]|nr:hypothetical protein [Methanobrevibacter sp.]